ncbi:MAG: nitrous oxide reductase family maturation protein NosD [Promethearchaeota archaeon]
MKSNKNVKLILIALGMMFAVATVINYNKDYIRYNDETSEINKDANLKSAKYWDLSFIHIKNDNWSGGLVDGWVSGSGILGDPWVIENVTINGQNLRDCILIEDSNDHFIVRNCTLYNAGGAWDAAGIKLINTNNGRLDNNTCSNTEMGIGVDYDSNNNNITENTVYNFDKGIYIDGDNNNITGNTVYDSKDDDGINIYGISNNIAENTVYNIDDDAISIWGDKNNITGNILYNNRRGISLGGSNSLLLNNKMEDCGIEIRGNFEEAISHDIDTTNEINGKPVYYYANETGLKSNDFKKYGDPGQAILVNCNHSIVSDLNISHSWGGITLSYCENNTIYNNTVSYNSYTGIDLFESNKNNISENFVYHNSRGIHMERCNSNNITDNIVNGNINGIMLTEGSYNIIVKNNTLRNNRSGIYLVEESYNNTLTQNSMTDCGVELDLEDTLYPTSNKIDTTNTVNGKPLYYYTNETGLKPINFANAGQVILINCNDSLISDFDVSYGTIGLLMYDCNNNTISNVTASYNHEYGIRLDSTSDDRYNLNNNISGNTANNNEDIAIYLGYGSNSTISGNTANNNEEEGIVIGWYCNNNNISGNTANNNGEEGIYIYRGNSNNISGNTANNNEEAGIRLWIINNSVVCNNIAYENLEEGILLGSSAHNSIVGNYLKYNEYAGIHLTWDEDDDEDEFPTNDNTIVGNHLINNTINVIESAGCEGNVFLCNKYTAELFMEITNEIFTTEQFNISFSIIDEINYGIKGATFQMWWDGDDVSSNVVTIGNGLYYVLLTPKTVSSGENPLLLSVTISAPGYFDKCYEIYLAVDPNTIDKGDGGGNGDDGGDDDDDGNGVKRPRGVDPLFIIGIISVGSAVCIISAVSIILIKKRRKR